MKMTRRAFLEATALATAGLALGACSPRQEGRIAAKTFGRTKHKSTRVIFGGYAFSSVTDPERVEQTIETLQEFGVNHIDTAPSYGGSHIWLGMVMKDRRDEYFLATKTDQRSYDAAKRQIESSLRDLQTDHVDLLQLHNLVDPAEWETAMGGDGALKAVLEAQEQGLTRFVGVTGHGVTAPAMHIKSFERHDFDTVLVPWNYPLAQNPQYAANFEALLALAKERKAAVQIIKSVAHGGPYAGASQRYNTWYRPLEGQESIDRAVHWLLGFKDVFVITAGDMDLLPMILDAGSRFRQPPSDDEMEQMAVDLEMQPLFT
jgi:predicted aldo/keto reductase-like oxidoreductase